MAQALLATLGSSILQNINVNDILKGGLKVVTGALKGGTEALDKAINPEEEMQSKEEENMAKKIENEYGKRKKAREDLIRDTNMIRPYIEEPYGRPYVDSPVNSVKKSPTKKQLEDYNKELHTQNAKYSDVLEFPESNYYGDKSRYTSGRKLKKAPLIKNVGKNNEDIALALGMNVGNKVNTSYD